LWQVPHLARSAGRSGGIRLMAPQEGQTAWTPDPVIMRSPLVAFPSILVPDEPIDPAE